MKKTRLIALLMAAMMVLAMFAGCSKEPAETPETPSTPSETPSTPSDTPSTPDATGKKIYKTYITSELATLNFTDNVDSNRSAPGTYAMSQLYRAYPNEDGTNYIFIYDLAAGEPIQVDDYTWNIPLREGAKWHDGTPINADTWMFTFQQRINPKMAPRMATFLVDNTITVVNGMNYLLQGTEGYPAEVAWEEVGFKKIDEYTIQVVTEDANTKEDVMKQFWGDDQVPVHEELWNECLSADGLTTSYGSDLDHFVGCGPYTFSDWQYDSMQTYTKVEDHWMAEYFHYDEVQVRIVPEMNARVELFEKGEIMSLTPDANTIETYIDDPRTTMYGSTSVYHIDINCKNPTNPISGNVNYRKAIYHAIDREVAAPEIFGYQQEVGTYVNAQAGMLSASGLTYRDSEYGQAVTQMVADWSADGHTTGYNPELALEYLNKALAEENVPEGTVITVKYAIDEGDLAWKALGEYMMEEWPTIFEGKMVLEIVPYAGMSATDFKKTGDDKWDLSPNEWTRGMSRTYPHTCFYYYLASYSGAPNNYFVPEFDAQYQVCEDIKLGDYDTLLKETQKLEEMYLDYVIHVPVAQVVNYELFAEELILPVKTYIPGFGWGAAFGDIAQ